MTFAAAIQLSFAIRLLSKCNRMSLFYHPQYSHLLVRLMLVDLVVDVYSASLFCLWDKVITFFMQFGHYGLAW